MPSEQHEYLSKLAAKWAKKQGFPVVATNLTAAGSREKVDLIAFRSSCSLMIESKVSRSDFFADAKKPERVEGGVGTYRFYITPFDMVSSTEIPDGWGLLYVDGKNVIDIIRPKGNLWPSITLQPVQYLESVQVVTCSTFPDFVQSLQSRVIINERQAITAMAW
jgi:hypothetical protein